MKGAKITVHAADRFIQRHAPHMSLQEARNFLHRASIRSNRLKEKTQKGQFQWEISDPRCVLVIKFDKNEPICVTVLPEPEINKVDLTAMECDFYESKPISPRADAFIQNVLNKKEKPHSETTRKENPAPKKAQAHIFNLRINPDAPDVTSARTIIGGPKKWEKIEKSINEAYGSDPESPKKGSRVENFVITEQNAVLFEYLITKQREKTRRHMISEQTTAVRAALKTLHAFMERMATKDPEIAHFMNHFDKEKNKKYILSKGFIERHF